MGHVWLGFAERPDRRTSATPASSDAGPPAFPGGAQSARTLRRDRGRAPYDDDSQQQSDTKEDTDAQRKSRPTLRRAREGPRPPFKVGTCRSPSSAARRSARRAGDAGLDGAARALCGQDAARRRKDHGLSAHDDPDRGSHRDVDRARRRRALGVVQHLLDAGPRGRRGRRRPSRNRRHGARTRRARRCSRGRARRSTNTGGAPSRRSCGPTAAARP